MTAVGPLLSPNKENDDSSNLTLCCLLDRKLSRKVEKMEYCPPPPLSSLLQYNGYPDVLSLKASDEQGRE